jgi:hypothetical protein
VAKLSFAVGLGFAACAAVAIVACRADFSVRHGDDSSGTPDNVSYNWDVRPILAQNCFACHGMDPKKRAAGLRLDQAESAYATLEDDKRRHAIVPGSTAKSEVFTRITSSDPDLRMPTVESHKVLTAREIATLKRWIEQGAKYEPHWAYQPLKQTAPERTKWDVRALNSIDRYVFANLEKYGMAPAPEADRETLINRVTLAITGLPPSLAEVDAFVADKRPDAYERVIDRLLATTAHAEHMTASWMDVARYANTDGYLFDTTSSVNYPYRDWVIHAYEQNMPYDKFVSWQLAGDLLPNPTRDQLLATSFLRVGKKNTEGGITDEEWRIENRNERAELVGSAFLGLTVNCARCHDHKYDVISQKDYYSLTAFFENIDEGGIHQQNGPRETPNGPTLAWPTPEQAQALGQATTLVKTRMTERDELVTHIETTDASSLTYSDEAQRDKLIQRGLDRSLQAYYPFESFTHKGSFDAVSKKKPQGRNIFNVQLDAKEGAPTLGRSLDTLEHAGVVGVKAMPPAEAPQDIKDERDLRPASMTWSPAGVAHEKPVFISNPHVTEGPPGKGKALLLDDTVGQASEGVGVVDRDRPFSFDLWVKIPRKTIAARTHLLFLGDTGGSPGVGYSLSLIEDGSLSFMLQNMPPYASVEILSGQPLPVEQWIHLTATYDGSSRAAGAKLYMNGAPLAARVLHDHLERTIAVNPLMQEYGTYNGVRFGRQMGAPELKGGALDELRVFTRAIQPVEVAYLHDPRSLAAINADEIKTQLAAVAASFDPAVERANKLLQEAMAAQQKVDDPIVQLMVLKDRAIPRQTYLHPGGLWNRRADPVPTQGLQRVFAYDRRLAPNRSSLARWLFDPHNPLTPRVYVNRLWQQYFGTGIVETVEDFGTQGANPTNPELLDYLAAEFVRSGWDIRHIQKMILMSATYRQSSNATLEAVKDDPRNLYLSRGPRFRMTAEMIRDNALTASGLLVSTVGGDSVFPYQPAGIWPGVSMGFIQYYPQEKDVPADNHHRRSLYTFIKRNAPYPAYTVFDFPNRNATHVSRQISNTPLQGLVTLNDVQYREASRKLAEHVLQASQDPNQQLTMVFRLLLRRQPLAGETAAMQQFRATELTRYQQRVAEAKRLDALGVAPVDPSIDPAQLAALSEVAIVVMNSPDAYSIH